MFFHWYQGRDATGIDALFEKQEPALSDAAVQNFQSIIQCDGYSAYLEDVLTRLPAMKAAKKNRSFAGSGSG